MKKIRLITTASVLMMSLAIYLFYSHGTKQESPTNSPEGESTLAIRPEEQDVAQADNSPNPLPTPTQEQLPDHQDHETSIEPNEEYPLNEEDLNEFPPSSDLLNTKGAPSPQPKPESFNAVFKGLNRAIISSKVTSTILKITHRMGENFQAGDLLIQLDDTVFVGLKRKAEGNLNKALAELWSKKQLYQEEIASLYEVKTAEANVAVAQSDLISANYSIDACHIIAPYNGKVVSLFVEEFELIPEAKPLIEIVNDEFLIGQVLVPLHIFQRIKHNQLVDVFMPALNQTVEARILRVDAVIDPASSTFKIDLLVNNQQGLLRAGMIGKTTLEQKNTYSPIQPVPASPLQPVQPSPPAQGAP